MTPPKQPTPGRRIGQGMLIASFTLGLVALTFFFDDRLENQSNPNRRPQYSETSSGIREVILQRNRQGHYVSSGQINKVPVTFLLDTGATDVAIPTDIARKAGLHRGLATRAATAGGVVTVYATQVDELVLGNITLHNIDGSIMPSMGGDIILLGMSALKQVEFTQRGSTLTLRQFPKY